MAPASTLILWREINDENVFENAEPPQQLAELFMLGVRQVGVARRGVFESQQVNMREAEILFLRAVVDAMLESEDAGNLILQLPEGVCHLLDLRRAAAGLKLEDDDVANRRFFVGCNTHNQH